MPWANDPDARRRSAATYQDPEYLRNRKAAWDRAGGRCEMLTEGRRCKSPKGCQVDHIKPVSQHGTHSLDNLRVLCGFHHGVKTAQEGRGYRGHRKAQSDPALQPRTTW